MMTVYRYAMEYYNNSSHETLQVLACDLCSDPEWTSAFSQFPQLKAHYCDRANEWRYGYYGSDVTSADAGETLTNLQAHERAQAREIANPVLKHINDVLEGPRVSER